MSTLRGRDLCGIKKIIGHIFKLLFALYSVFFSKLLHQKYKACCSREKNGLDYDTKKYGRIPLR